MKLVVVCTTQSAQPVPVTINSDNGRLDLNIRCDDDKAELRRWNWGDLISIGSHLRLAVGSGDPSCMVNRI